MKKLMALSVILTIAAGAHSTALLKYRCSDGNMQSRLQIEDNGLVIISESNAEGDSYSKTKKLSSDQATRLRNIISSLDPKAIYTHPTEVGKNNQGALVGYHQGKEVVIFNVDADIYERIGNAQKNTSCSDLEWLKNLILPWVKNKLNFEWPVVESPILCDFDLTKN